MSRPTGSKNKETPPEIVQAGEADRLAYLATLLLEIAEEELAGERGYTMHSELSGKNAVAAIRVSTTKQGTDGDSPEAQKEQIERFAADKGITIKKYFRFHGISQQRAAAHARSR
jgi:hypothetical protein